jgi:hypothetical protein
VAIARPARITQARSQPRVGTSNDNLGDPRRRAVRARTRRRTRSRSSS